MHLSHLHLLRFAWYFLWVVPHLVFLPAIAFLMFRRGWHRRFPFFFAYTLYECVQVLTTFPLSRSSVSDLSYRIVAGIFLLGSISLRFAIVCEIFRHVAREYAALARIGKGLFAGTLLVMLVLAIVAGVLQTGGNADRLANMGSSLSQSTSLIQSGLLISLLIFSLYFKLSWDNFALGIAIGVGVYASTNLAVAATVRQIAPLTKHTQILIDFIVMGTYQCCVLVWLGYLLAPRTVRATNSVPPHDLELWSNELQELVQR